MRTNIFILHPFIGKLILQIGARLIAPLLPDASAAGAGVTRALTALYRSRPRRTAAYALVMPLFGMGAELGLAVSLLKRARDMIVGVPILLLWQGTEGQRLLSRPRP